MKKRKQMNNLKLIFFTIALSASIYYYGCDDSGLVIDPEPKGGVLFSQANLKTLETGQFELWLSLVDSGNVRTWYTLGRFNISSNGTLVDPGGAAVKFKFPGDTNLLYQAKDVLVTYEVDSDLLPSSYRIMSGVVTASADSFTCDLKISGAEALGSVGSVLLGENIPNPAFGWYYLGSPTTNEAECLKGLWLCDPNGASNFTPGLDIPGSLSWKYQGWVKNNVTQQSVPTGKFASFYGPDQDGPGQCAGTLDTAYSKPGQEFAAGCPTGELLNNGIYGFFITLEPDNVTLTSPFFFKLFRSDVIPGITCSNPDFYFRSMARDDLVPRAHIRIFN